MNIWCNAKLGEAQMKRLQEGVGKHKLTLAAGAQASVLAEGKPDPTFAEADIAFGQPAPSDCAGAARLRWVQLSSAGYTRFDTDQLREGFRSRGTALTTSSAVFADPCAQHVLAMVLAMNRALPAWHRDQGAQAWNHKKRGAECRLLTGQTVLLLGFGAIGKRLAELLAPFSCTVYAVRRQTRSELGVRIVPEEDLTRVLALADHVIDLLPQNDATVNWVNARRLACFKQGAKFYNVGRGQTVDQDALLEALRSGRLGGVYLDVMNPEPPPAGHPLWTEPNCYITPHAAGGRPDEAAALVEHFLKNLAAFEQGKPLTDRIV
jgi:phosphoglycerate dehydrogenase-like enzyme